MKMPRKELYQEEHTLDLKVVIALNRSTNLINRQANTIFRAHGLTQMQFAVLEVLYHKGNLKISQIIEKILSTGGNVTVVINNLEKEHMIEKLSDPSDSRVSIISITEKGCKKIEDIFPHYLADLGNNLERLSIHEKQALLKILQKLSI